MPSTRRVTKRRNAPPTTAKRRGTVFSKEFPRLYTLAATPIDEDVCAVAYGEALKALHAAYEPYSKFRVGCSIVCADGSIFKGCNVETANYDGSHAEEIALGAMVVAERRDPVVCICLGGLEGHQTSVIGSCGKCRQALKEFSSLTGMEIWLMQYDGDGSYREPLFAKLSELLPRSFGPADIGVDLTKYRR